MTAQHPSPKERDEPVVLPLDPETALRGLLAVDPDAAAGDVEAKKDPAHEGPGE